MNSELKNPFLFACGVPRSGTTLLQRMLNSHPELAVVNDSHFIPRALELTNKSLVNDGVSGEAITLTNELVENIRNYHRFYRMEIAPEQFESALEGARTYQELVSQLYEQAARNAGKSLAGEKTPDYSRRLRLLNGLFPQAKLIHLVRDGRNVALSLMQWAKPDKGPGRIELWNESPVAVCALWWSWLALEGSKQSAEIEPTSCIEIKYEYLVSDAVATLQQLCEFLGLEYSSQMANYHQGKSSTNVNLSAKSAWLAPKKGLRCWKSDMDEKQVQLFEALASDALIRFGYEVQSTSFSPEIQDRAARYQQWWDENFLSKHKNENFEPGSLNAMPESVEANS